MAWAAVEVLRRKRRVTARRNEKPGPAALLLLRTDQTSGFGRGRSKAFAPFLIGKAYAKKQEE